MHPFQRVALLTSAQSVREEENEHSRSSTVRQWGQRPDQSVILNLGYMSASPMVLVKDLHAQAPSPDILIPYIVSVFPVY